MDTAKIIPLRYFSRTQTETDTKCARAGFLNYEVNGRGVSSTAIQLELFLGSALHDGLAAIAFQHQDLGAVDIDTIASSVREHIKSSLLEVDPSATQFANEQACLIEGLLRVYYRTI